MVRASGDRRETDLPRSLKQYLLPSGNERLRDNALMRAALDPLVVRRLTVDDAGGVAELCGQLGYAASAAELQHRIGAIARSADRIALAAVSDGQLVGWIDAAIERHLQAPDTVVIGGLVVRDSARGCGVGRRLCAEIEEWARSQGIPVVRVRSQMKREDAHRFYLRDGYRQVKTSLVFEKSVE
jgi:GNAT superfamily N-acetyltransferase